MEELYYVNKDLVRNIIVTCYDAMIGQPLENGTIGAMFNQMINKINLLPTLSKSQLFNTAELVWWEEWSPSTPECPRECIAGGWKCGNCQEDLGDYLTRIGGERCYFDKFEEKPKLAFCPACGRKFK